MVWIRIVLICVVLAMIVWALMEFRTRPTRKLLTEAEVYEAMTGRKRPSEATAFATDQFSAWTYCPSCGEFGCHAMRETNPDVWKKWSAGRAKWLELQEGVPRQRIELRQFGGGRLRVIDEVLSYPVREPIHESEYATIRICKCGKEWGQK